MKGGVSYDSLLCLSSKQSMPLNTTMSPGQVFNFLKSILSIYSTQGLAQIINKI